MALGTVSISEVTIYPVKEITFAWTSGTAAAPAGLGTASGTTSEVYTGQILRAVTVPGSVDVPTAAYDITLTNEAGVDVSVGKLADRSATLEEWVTSGMGAVVGDKLTINVSNAGSAKTGTLIIYVGVTPEEAASDTVALQDALYGSAGIPTWPIAAAPGDGGNLAKAVRYMVETQIGTLYNTIGVPTLGGMIGDPGNRSIVERLDAIEETTEEVEHHFHTSARWFGLSGSVTATNWGDDTLTPFVATSGDASAYGGATDADIARVLGKADTPILDGQLFFDMDNILIISATQTSVYKLRFLWGTGTWAEAVAAGQYTETMAIVISAASKNTKEQVRMPRLRCGLDQVWCQVKNATNDATISFFVGVHGYDA